MLDELDLGYSLFVKAPDELMFGLDAGLISYHYRHHCHKTSLLAHKGLLVNP